MKDELIKFIMERADKEYNDDFPISHIPDWINEFFTQYQPERSKREDFDEYAGNEIDWALDRSFQQEMNQKSHDILSSVCKFAKMRCSEL